MTDPDAPTAELPRPRPRREPIRKPGPLAVIAGSLGLFLAVTALLALQLRAGSDPVLGAGEPQVVAAASPPRKIVIHRRVIVTRIVEHRAPAASRGAVGTPAAAGERSGASSGGVAPAGSAAPAAAAPSAPAPAPLTTRSS